MNSFPQPPTMPGQTVHPCLRQRPAPPRPVCYVADFFANSVDVIDIATNTVVKAIPVGSNPWGVALNPRGSLACVTNFNSGNVYLIDTKTNEITGSIAVGSGPLGVAFAPKGAKAYVNNCFSNSVSVINTAKKSVIKTIPVQGYPYGIAVTPNGQFVYVANWTSRDCIGNLGKNKQGGNDHRGWQQRGLFDISPDGTTVYVPTNVNNDGTPFVSVVSTASNQVVNTIGVDGHRAPK